MNLIDSEQDTKIEVNYRVSHVKQVRRYGDLNTDAILDSHCKKFSIPSIDGFVGYRIESNCAVVFGDPVCDSADKLQLAKAFQIFCEEQRLNVIYAIISEQFAKSALNQYGRVLIQFGHKLILDPNDNPVKRTGPRAVLVRKKVKRALNAGVLINEYLTDDPALEKVMEQVGESWLKSRHGPQIHIAHFDFFNDREGKRWFYAKQEGRIVGFLMLNETQASSGWLLNNLIITNDAPPGTSELLITSILEILVKENCKCVSIGPVTAAQIDHIVGLGAVTSLLVRAGFKAAKYFFRLDGQTVFWEKFQPKEEPSYIMFDKVNFRTVKALLRAMNARI